MPGFVAELSLRVSSCETTSNTVLFALKVNFILTMIGVPLVADMLRSVLPAKAYRVSLQFSGCFMFISIALLKIHYYHPNHL
jgi:hypothetical protein